MAIVSHTKKVGILLVNMGSPSAPEKDAVTSYLRAFLGDKNILTTAPFLRFLLVRLLIFFRKKSLVKAYRQIWTAEGSPLLVHSQRIANKLEHQTKMPTAIAMLYGSPSVSNAFKSLADKGIDHIMVCPLFPQGVTGILSSIKEQCTQAQAETPITFEIRPPFYDHPTYIQALASTISPFLLGEFPNASQQNSPSIQKKSTSLSSQAYFHREAYEAFIFSFHGLPCSEVRKVGIRCNNRQMNDPNCVQLFGDEACKKCYKYQCLRTTHLLSKTLNLPKNKVFVSFQSRLPWTQTWLAPSTKEVVNLPVFKRKNLFVIAPSFPSDCLETLYEIQIKLQQQAFFLNQTSLTVAPSLNDHDLFVLFLENFLGKTNSPPKAGFPKPLSEKEEIARR